MAAGSEGVRLDVAWLLVPPVLHCEEAGGPEPGDTKRVLIPRATQLRIRTRMPSGGRRLGGTWPVHGPGPSPLHPAEVLLDLRDLGVDEATLPEQPAGSSARQSVGPIAAARVEVLLEGALLGCSGGGQSQAAD